MDSDGFHRLKKKLFLNYENLMKFDRVSDTKLYILKLPLQFNHTQKCDLLNKHFAFHHYIFYIPSAIILYDIWCENLTLISESGISHRRNLDVGFFFRFF